MVILMLWILVREVQDYEAKKEIGDGTSPYPGNCS
jgi:hypothetical protein